MFRKFYSLFLRSSRERLAPKDHIRQKKMTFLSLSFGMLLLISLAHWEMNWFWACWALQKPSAVKTAPFWIPSFRYSLF